MVELDKPGAARLVPLLLCSVLCGAVACGSGARDSDAGKRDSKPDRNVSSAAAAPIDACAMVPAQDIAALLGTTVQGKSTSIRPDMGECTWENRETYESVSLEIGNPGTAPNNTLPPVDPVYGFTPGPDGMRYMGSGQVGFAAGDRSNTVQVAVLRLSAEEANAAAVDLAHKIAPKVPS
ncbi:hypothetical protein K3U94_12170 [Mycolicibacter heraklionensis]|uniref:DUF3558 domain-containing protein n=1 Tax=Mycolicibacter heraklionensis TaxID=512402 RepID=A0A9X7ZEY6_9MYCO|nr:hypothetical protein [Mycolicibacter heraklionensis]QZA05842.1 hypothetical protein K3U94_12170 [Mycolicibacter heraklionensis]